MRVAGTALGYARRGRILLDLARREQERPLNREIFSDFFTYFIQHASSAAPQIPLCRRMPESNSHQDCCDFVIGSKDALTTWLYLIHQPMFFANLFFLPKNLPDVQIYLLEPATVDFANSSSETMVGQEFRIGLGRERREWCTTWSIDVCCFVWVIQYLPN